MNIADLENKIINADCMDILKQLPDKSVDLVLTDPPYILDMRGGKSKNDFGNRKLIKDKHIEFIANDFDSESVFLELLRVSKKSKFHYILL